MNTEHPVRAVIREHLRNLAAALGQFEQTTHASLFLPGSMWNVTEALRDCYEKPSAFRISELDQRLTSFTDPGRAHE